MTAITPLGPKKMPGVTVTPCINIIEISISKIAIAIMKFFKLVDEMTSITPLGQKMLIFIVTTHELNFDLRRRQ